MNRSRQVKTKRAYDSTSRQQAAEQTQRRILDASRKLFSRSGIDKVTIAEIAGQSEVAASTIYALFGSKAGVLRALMLRAVFNTDYEAMVRKLQEVLDPIEQLRVTAGVARSIYDGESKEVGLLRGASAFSPELKKLERELEERRYELQHERLVALFDRGLNLPSLSFEQARDVMWTLTSRDVYRMLVTERRWPADRYEAWLGQMLVASLTRQRL
jgi:AcrR family transcriptional regulator